MTRYYYAIQYRYGSHVLTTGHLRDTIRRFPTRAERDNWVRSGPAYFTAPGYREGLKANHPDVRRAKEDAAWFGSSYWKQE